LNLWAQLTALEGLIKAQAAALKGKPPKAPAAAQEPRGRGDNTPASFGASADPDALKSRLARVFVALAPVGLRESSPRPAVLLPSWNGGPFRYGIGERGCRGYDSGHENGPD